MILPHETKKQAYVYVQHEHRRGRAANNLEGPPAEPRLLQERYQQGRQNCRLQCQQEEQVSIESKGKAKRGRGRCAR